MEILRRILVAIGGLALLATSVFLAFCLLSHNFAVQVVDYLDYCLLYTLKLILIDGYALGLTLVVGVLVFVIGVAMIVCACWQKKRLRRMSVSTGEGSSVEISLDAIKNVVHRAASQVPAVNGLRSTISEDKGALKIMLDVVVPPGESIPSVGAAVRQTVAEQVEAMTGIVPQDITVRISNVADKIGEA